MSLPSRMPRGRTADVGETVASYADYERAQEAVSQLIVAEVPARDIAIVGMGLRSIERVTGRLGYATAARSGAINGLLLGLIFSAFLVFGSPSVPVPAFIGVMFVGIALGMLMSIVAYSFVRRRRDFASAMQVVADHYDVKVTSGSLAKAREVLGTHDGRPPAPPRRGGVDPGPVSPPPQEPPRYGQRIVATPAEERSPAVQEPGPAEPGAAEPEATGSEPGRDA
ncbi:MAG: hypothetical protein QM611_09485 [Microbacterium sp.]|uniref:general stress protein n=1 Tax=Microbacterium sp. TaxID=51671 RepID=UPI0039E6BAB1